MSNTVIVDYGMGNLRSVLRRIEKLGFPAAISSDPEVVSGADKIILPGVGAFKSGMLQLEERGLTSVLHEKAMVEKVPTLGICLGMQLIAQASEEGDASGLGWIDADVIRFRFEAGGGEALKVPHMGWNTVSLTKPQHPFVSDLEEAPRFYFVHSYHLRVPDAELVLGTTNYGYDFPAIVAQGNIWAAQFHPEKSHQFGVTLLKSFLEKSG